MKSAATNEDLKKLFLERAQLMETKDDHDHTDDEDVVYDKSGNSGDH